ncbi:MAG: MvaI/BcnI family restriction endonuclease [Bacteroidetes bacterium]|nr:MvaI/BcnI family restriction endonuclease [Bacteroidota bacterium]
MNLPEIQQRLQEIKDLGFIPTEREGPTGIGYTLEQQLGITENNLPIPDIGGRVEIKSTRSNANNLITLFTFNRGVWKLNQKDIIEKWGYIDDNERLSFYNTVSITPNTMDLQIKISSVNETISVVHAPTNQELATWDLYHIVGKFMVKFERLLLINADVRKSSDNREEFHYNHAQLLTNPSSKPFREGFESGKVMIDIRMFLKESGSVRNHGTGFRIKENDLPILFEKSVKLM